MNTLPEEVAQRVRSSAAVRRGSRILVAVSGGVDSMVLLHLLHEWAPTNEVTLVCAHLNHGLRGRSSAADERFVREQCRRLDVSCTVGHRDVKSFAKRRALFHAGAHE